MEPEGMVHALKDIHRMLVPGGVLVDIHPHSFGHFIQAYQDGRLLFSERVYENESEYVLHAEKAISQVTDRKIFTIEDNAEFDFMIYGSSVPELSAYWDSLDAFEDQKDETIAEREKKLFAQVDTILRTSGEGSQAAIRERVRITLLRAKSQ